VDPSALLLRRHLGLLLAVLDNNDEHCGSVGEKNDWQGKPKHSKKTYHSAPLSTTNPTCLDPSLNPDRPCEKPASNRLTYDTASFVNQTYLFVTIVHYKYQILGIIHRPVFYLKYDVSEIGFLSRSSDGIQLVEPNRQNYPPSPVQPGST
jgi:hypothetical protein